MSALGTLSEHLHDRRKRRLLWIRLLKMTCYSRLFIFDTRIQTEAYRSTAFRAPVIAAGDSAGGGDIDLREALGDREMHSFSIEVDGKELEVRELDGPADLEALNARRNAHDYDPEEALERGERCLLVRHEGEVMACAWFVLGEPAWIEYLNFWWELAPNECYECGIWVHRDYRGLRVVSAVNFATRLYVERQAEEQGVTEPVGFVSAVLPENDAMLRTVHRRGGIITEKWVRLRFGPWQRIVRRPAKWKPKPNAQRS